MPSDLEKRLIAQNTWAEPARATGFMENISAAFKMTAQEDLSISSLLSGRGEAIDKRNKQINELIASGEIDQNLVSQYSVNSIMSSDSLDYDGLAYYFKTQLGQNVMTDQDIDTVIRKNLKERRQELQQVMNSSTAAGKVGSFMGMAGAIAIDPLLLPTYFVGIGSAAKGAQLIKAIGKVAGTELVTEAGRQAFIYNWKAEQGVDYTVEDAVMNIALSAGAVTAIASLPHGIKALSAKSMSAKLDNIIEAGKNSDDPLERFSAQRVELRKKEWESAEAGESAVEVMQKAENAEQTLNRSNSFDKGVVRTTPEEALAHTDEELEAFAEHKKDMRVEDGKEDLLGDKVEEHNARYDETTSALECI